MMKFLIVVLAVLAVAFAAEEATKDKRAVGYTGYAGAPWNGLAYSGVGAAAYPYGYSGIPAAYSGYPGYGYGYGYNGVYSGALNTGYLGGAHYY